jgi:hypothetical protein
VKKPVHYKNTANSWKEVPNNLDESIMKFAEEFKKSTRTHILMITNHGMHHWKIIPGLPDTGGQNVFVNEFSDALANQGFRIRIKTSALCIWKTVERILSVKKIWMPNCRLC